MVSELTADLSGPDETVFSHQALTRADILALDRLAAAAWMAPEREEHGGWLFRFADGVSRRANSIAPFPLQDGTQFENAIARAEAFYRARGLPPRLQISPAAEPEGLDGILDARGYKIESGVTIMIADARSLANGDAGNADIDQSAPDGWWDTYIEAYSRDARSVVAEARDQAFFAQIIGDGGAIEALGLGVIGGRWLGVFGMYTRPACRRRGLAQKIIAALARFAVDQGVIGVYLQVEDDNPTARALYEKLGFRAVYGYYYRTLWNQP